MFLYVVFRSIARTHFRGEAHFMQFCAFYAITSNLRKLCKFINLARARATLMFA
jgi:hypothetical protein